MNHLLKLFLAAAILPVMTSCGMFTQYEKEDCSLLSGKDAMRCVDYRQRKAHADMSHEVSELLKAYRQCIEKSGSDTEKGRANCSMYRDVLQSIQVSSMSCS